MTTFNLYDVSIAITVGHAHIVSYLNFFDSLLTGSYACPLKSIHNTQCDSLVFFSFLM